MTLSHYQCEANIAEDIASYSFHNITGFLIKSKLQGIHFFDFTYFKEPNMLGLILYDQITCSVLLFLLGCSYHSFGADQTFQVMILSKA